MGVDRELVRAFGYLTIGVIAVSAGASAVIAFGTDNFDAIWLFVPLLVGYSALLALLSMGLALYVFIRSKADRLH